MYIKIYFGNKPVFLCDALDKELVKLLHYHDTIFINKISKSAIQNLLQQATKKQFYAGIVLGNDLVAIKKIFFKHFTQIEAAGGMVVNEKKEILFIYRLGKWDLPKGKIEKTEQPNVCALREIQEETGATNLQIKNKIGKTYHTYQAYGKYFIKTTHWYFVHCFGKQNLLPQIEENITAIKWVKEKKLSGVQKNTYPAIIDIINKFLSK